MAEALDLWVEKEGLDKTTADKVREEARRYIALLTATTGDQHAAA
jgi:hypothetical protein